jgi:hypothetical protein
MAAFTATLIALPVPHLPHPACFSVGFEALSELSKGSVMSQSLLFFTHETLQLVLRRRTQQLMNDKCSCNLDKPDKSVSRSAV